MPAALDSGGGGQSFSTVVGLVYVFNLIVGTGALALPKAFQSTGYVLSVVLLLISAFTSYVCATFIIECLSIANAVIKLNPAWHERTRHETISSAALGQLSSSEESLISTSRETSPFAITQRAEVSEMSHFFLGRGGVLFTYLALSIYLFGDLAIYSTTVPKSMMNVLCSSMNISVDAILVTGDFGDQPCHYSPSFPAFATRFFVYRCCVVIFALFCLQMVIIGMTRTKYVQLATTFSRWTAFLLMIILATVQLCQTGKQGHPPPANVYSFGSFFGVAVYAFMCHHSLPGLVTPMRETARLNYRLVGVYGVIFLFYCTLSLTGSFAFPVVQDVYTLNFFHDEQTGSIAYTFIDYFLALFPVFTLTSSYVIVAITLTNNVRVLLKMVGGGNGGADGGERQPVGRSNSLSRNGLVNDGEENESLLHNGSGNNNAEASSSSSEEESVVVNEDATETVASTPDASRVGSNAESAAVAAPSSPLNQRRSRHYSQRRRRRRPSSSLMRTDNVNLDSMISTDPQAPRRLGSFCLLADSAALPALIIAFSTSFSMFTDNVMLLASITGSYPGVGVQFIIPSILALSARKFLKRNFIAVDIPREWSSPFSHWLWPYLTIGWAVCAVAVVSANLLHAGG